jgi:hypothetical protein
MRRDTRRTAVARVDARDDDLTTCSPPAGANEFAAGKSQSPPARTRRHECVRRSRRLRVRSREASWPAKRSVMSFRRSAALYCRIPRTRRAIEKSTVGILVAGRCAPGPRPQSAKADFAIFQRRIHSLLAGTRRHECVRRSRRLRVRSREASSPAKRSVMSFRRSAALYCRIHEPGARLRNLPSEFSWLAGALRARGYNPRRRISRFSSGEFIRSWTGARAGLRESGERPTPTPNQRQAPCAPSRL